MKLRELERRMAQGMEFDAVIQAVDAVVYLVQVRERHSNATSIDPPVCITDAKAKRLVFRNRNGAQQCLARLGFKEVTLVQDSAYGEMIGGPVGGDSQLRHTYPISLED